MKMQASKIFGLTVACLYIGLIGAEWNGADAFVAEATEIIGVVKIGVSLVDYIYKVFSKIFRESGLEEADWTGKLIEAVLQIDL